MIKFIVCATLLSIVCAAPQTPAQVPAAAPAKSPAAGPAAASSSSSDATAEVKNYTDQVNPDGSFSYQFDTSNGINIQESGSANGTVQGAVQYQSPEGEQIQLSYIADENGYQPSGSHLPTSPPVPENIARALEYIQSHPPPTEAAKTP